MIRLAGREVVQDSTSKSDLHGWASRLDDQPGGQARSPESLRLSHTARGGAEC